jgi:hypothetical protein
MGLFICCKRNNFTQPNADMQLALDTNVNECYDIKTLRMHSIYNHKKNKENTNTSEIGGNVNILSRDYTLIDNFMRDFSLFIGEVTTRLKQDLIFYELSREEYYDRIITLEGSKLGQELTVNVNI